jgi:hypothetical protein
MHRGLRQAVWEDIEAAGAAVSAAIFLFMERS